MDAESVAEEIVNEMDVSEIFSNLSNKTLAKQIIQDRLEQLEIEHETDLDSLQEEIDMYREDTPY